MNIEIRPATVKDVWEIAEINRLTFSDEIDLKHLKILQLLSNNHTFIAVDNGQVVGFVDNFLTISQDNQIRLELDLLAVRPDYRVQGIGRRLIEKSLILAEQLKVSQVRALIAEKNVAMHHLCMDNGLVQSDKLHELRVKPAQKLKFTDGLQLSNGYLIRVDTLTYKGIWIEDELTQSAIDNSAFIVSNCDLDIIGVVVPTDDTKAIELLAQNDFDFIDNYHQWTLNLRNDLT